MVDMMVGGEIAGSWVASIPDVIGAGRVAKGKVRVWSGWTAFTVYRA
jgi:hypothetical protein